MNQGVAVVSLLLSLALAGCGRHAAELPAPEPKVSGASVSLPAPSPQLASLATERALTAKPSALQLNGRLAWDDDATVRVYSAFGGRVTRVDVQIGQFVHRGDVLAEVASPDYGQAEADAHSATSALRLAERTEARAKDLFDHDAASRRDLDAAEADLDRAKAERERAVARLSAYGAKEGAVDGTFALRSPIDGEVVERNLSPGQEVRPDQILAGTPALTAPLFTVTDPTRLWVVLDVSEHDAPLLRAGQPCVLRTHMADEGTFPARIAVVSQFLDPTTRTVKARGTVANDDRQLRAEMLVTVEVAPDSERTVQEVPSRAVFLEGENHFVFVDGGNGRFERTRVEIGAEREGWLQIREGLASGSSVVTDGALLLEKIYRDSAGS
ncbi:MAG TPA: efflux RND transporter periplasmic adaptor subunit [Myxococcota bacterium]|nr:efflux RND transporter periplasmic adaptor subunit [Myxococcota bacterium]